MAKNPIPFLHEVVILEIFTDGMSLVTSRAQSTNKYKGAIHSKIVIAWLERGQQSDENICFPLLSLVLCTLMS